MGKEVVAIAIACATAAACGFPRPTRAKWVTYGVDGCGLSIALPAKPQRSRQSLSLRLDDSNHYRAHCERAAARRVSSRHSRAAYALGSALTELFRRGYTIDDADYIETDGVPGVAVLLSSPDGRVTRLLGAYVHGETLLVLDASVAADGRENLAQFTKSLRVGVLRRTVAGPVLGELQ